MLALIITIAIMVAAAAIFVFAMFSIVKSGRSSNQLPMVAPDVARKHLPLIFLIRGPQILLLGIFLALVAFSVLDFLLSSNPFHRQSALSETYSVIMWIITLLLAAAIVAKFIDSHRKSETRLSWDILRVDTHSISTFACIFAAFLSHDLYHFMPPTTPASLREHPGFGGLFLERDSLWLLVFWLGWYSIKALLIHILDLRPKLPPENLEPPWQPSQRTF